MMVINNNLPALNAYDIVNNTSNQLQKSIQKLSTGLRINSAADDAAGLSISEKMRAQISGLDQAVRNTQDGISLIQTAEGALTETHSILQRMRELSVQAANDTYTAQDRSYIQEEVDLLREEIDHIGNTTTFNTKKLLNGDSAALWSSDNLNTKAIVNGGLRNIDQFGQKSSAEGNYKITVKAQAGVGEIQKTDIFRIKHDLDFDVVGTGKFNGAALENEANVEGIGSQGLTINVSDGTNTISYALTLQHDLSDTKGLADAINSTMSEVTSVTPIQATAPALTEEGDLVSTSFTGTGITNANLANYKVVAGVDDNGNLTLTNSSGYAITLQSSDSTDDLQNVLGATDETTLNAQEYNTTFDFGNSATPANWETSITPANTYTFGVKASGSNIVNVTLSGTAIQGFYNSAEGTGTEKANNALSALKNEIVSQLNSSAATAEGISAALDSSGKLAIKSEAGAITISNGTPNDLLNAVFGITNAAAIASASTAGNTVYTNKTNTWVNTSNAVDTTNAETNFARNFNDTVKASFDVTVSGKKTTITIGGAANTTLAAKLTADPTYKITAEDLATDIQEQLQANDDLKNKVIVRLTDDNKVRIFSESADLTLEATDGGKGTLNAIFGDITTDTTNGVTVTYEADPGTTAGSINKIVVASQTEAGTTDDTTLLARDYSFKIKDEYGDEIASISMSGPFDDINAMADTLNSKLAAVADDAASDFKAIVTKNSDGDKTLALYSTTRDFTLENGDDVDSSKVWGYEALFGKSTSADAEQNLLKDVTTIGDVASSDTKLRDLEKFWDSQGNFMLEDPQTITITQGDGQQAKVTLYKYDTLGDMAQKFNDAIANDLGQAQYLSNSDDAGNFVSFVDTPTTSGNEAVEGTMLIRSIVPGVNGSLNFASKNEDLINALSLNTIQKADDSVYYVTVQDAHSGQVVNGIEDEKITGNVLVGKLHKNIDVEFDAQTGITAAWDDANKTFVMSGTYTGDSSVDKGEVTYLHLSDNTMVFQIGANEGDDMGVNIGDMRSHALGLDGVLVTDHESASRSISIIDSAIDKVSTQRAKLGAYQNRLEHTSANLTTSAENLTAAESRIRDTDMAKTMMDFTKLQIMLQAGNSMLAQANQLPQNVLSLIR